MFLTNELTSQALQAFEVEVIRVHSDSVPNETQLELERDLVPTALHLVLLFWSNLSLAQCLWSDMCGTFPHDYSCEFSFLFPREFRFWSSVSSSEDLFPLTREIMTVMVVQNYGSIGSKVTVPFAVLWHFKIKCLCNIGGDNSAVFPPLLEKNNKNCCIYFVNFAVRHL